METIEDPVLRSYIQLLDAVVRHGNILRAKMAEFYGQGLLDSADESEEGQDNPVILDHMLAELILCGYDLTHQHRKVTPSMEADFVIPVSKAKEFLAKRRQ